MKKTNKGFSLVELIIVIAIMAILAGAIAPALIRYIDKSRRSNDVNSAKTIKTAIETALGNESIYEYMTNGAGNCTVECFPGQPITATSNVADTVIKIEGGATATTYGFANINGKSFDDVKIIAKNTIGKNIGEKVPKLKYKKNPRTKTGAKPNHFVGVVSQAGTVYVFITTNTGTPTFSDDAANGIKGTDGTDFQISPYMCDEYQ